MKLLFINYIKAQNKNKHIKLMIGGEVRGFYHSLVDTK